MTDPSQARASAYQNKAVESSFNSYVFLALLAILIPIGFGIAIALRTYCTPRRGEKIVEDTDFPESSESEGLRNAVST